MMMRLPAHRKQISDANFAALNELMEAYGMAVLSRDELREQRTSDPKMLKEFEDLCQELEDDIVKMLAGVSPRMVR
ncbi:MULTISPECIES: nodulation protein [unclassified Ensifer]|uniref:nodulation protein n=1 Tax=unclassified Ensifer TaxID=2633371 RepID=UPI0012E73A2A|nr:MULTISPECIES: nodulation protein [unclassified Ensifer]